MGFLRAGPKDIAGAKVTQKFLSVMEHETIGSIKNRVLSRAKDLDVIDYIYVLDDEGILTGVVSHKEILIANHSLEVKNIMKWKLVTINYHSDQEMIISLVLRHKLKAIPVVGKDTPRLEGVISYPAILSVMHHEFREDIMKSGGIHHSIHEIEELTTPATRLIRARIPSLLVGLLGGLVAASIIGEFEDIIGSYVILAAFLPVMIYLSDAVGTQSQTLVVRMLALEPGFSVAAYLFRELKVGLAIAAVSGSLLLLATLLAWLAPLQIVLAIGVSIFLSILFQSFAATYLSVLLSKLNIDPATTSGPLTTIISDLSTITIYFIVASMLLQLL